MSAFPVRYEWLGSQSSPIGAGVDWNKICGYYGFPYFNVPDPNATPERPKPTTCLEVLKQHEENVEKALDAMPQIEKLIIYSVLNRQGVRMDSIDREIYREAQKELKANG